MTDTIRRHANGSIDTDHYVRQCHRQRSEAAHKTLDAAKGGIRHRFASLAGLRRFLTFKPANPWASPSQHSW